ncbi:MAG: hypothetical protein IT373_37750, partial [Polyangiaceae bacterium]|nr:hypothetical protein [Polyangiaceae bacterium]
MALPEDTDEWIVSRERLSVLGRTFDNPLNLFEGTSGRYDIDTNRRVTVGTGYPSFLFMDCGLWGYDASDTAVRNFAIVAGNRALLCNFVADGRGDDFSERPGTVDDPTLRALWRALGAGRRITLMKEGVLSMQPDAVQRGDIPGRTDPTIYVFIPDMHMPLLCGRRPAGDDGPAMGRVRYSEHGPSAV